MPLEIVRQDITKMQVDAVVNATNQLLKPGSGVCGAIFAAAGREKLAKACNRIGFCNTGMAVMTKGYALPARYIIHTVGPVYEEGDTLQEQLLYACYKNSLLLAAGRRLRSVAVPLISAGCHGYPKEESLRIARQAITDFLNEYEMMVYLVVYDSESFSIGKSLFDNIKAYIDEATYISDAYERRLKSAYSAYIDTECTKAPDVCSQSIYDASPRRLEDVLKNIDESFSQMLIRLIDERGLKDPDVYKKANIDRKLFSKIRNSKNYKPKKSTVLSFAIALELSLDETNDLLSKAGFVLSHSNKADIIIEYFIERKIYNIFEINEALFAFDQPLLSI